MNRCYYFNAFLCFIICYVNCSLHEIAYFHTISMQSFSVYHIKIWARNIQQLALNINKLYAILLGVSIVLPLTQSGLIGSKNLPNISPLTNLNIDRRIQAVTEQRKANAHVVLVAATNRRFQTADNATRLTVVVLLTRRSRRRCGPHTFVIVLLLLLLLL